MNRESEKRREHGPERRGGQGLDPHQYESGDATILALLAESSRRRPRRSRDHVARQRRVRSLVASRDDSLQALCRRPRRALISRSSSKSARTRSRIRIRSSSRPSARNWTPPPAAAIRTDDPNRAYFEPHVHQPSVRLRTNRAVVRQSARARPDRQSQGLRLWNPAGAAWRARRRAMPRAAGVQRAGCAPRTSSS